MYRLSSNEKLIKKLTTFLRIKVIQKKLFKPVSFEELLMLAGGYGVSKIDVSSGNPMIGLCLFYWPAAVDIICPPHILSVLRRHSG